MLMFWTSLLLSFVVVEARPSAVKSRPFADVLKARQASTNGTGLEVDLGYAVYAGSANASTNLNVFRGIRFAAPPTGTKRWQAPAAPSVDRSSTIQATRFASQCPQSPNAGYTSKAQNNSLSSEDCLFLNVYSPNNVTGPLPVLVWIHGGGYGAGNGAQDLSAIINTNGNAFVGVSIQYRVSKSANVFSLLTSKAWCIRISLLR